jgi:hypothetical protein
MAHAAIEIVCRQCILDSWLGNLRVSVVRVAMPYLEELRQIPAHVTPFLNQAISTIPRRWLEAYAACVGSPLELKFLRLVPRSRSPGGALFH